MIKFTVYGIPVAKGRPRFTRSGFAYTPKETTTAEHNFKSQSFKHRPGMPLKGPVSLVARFFLPIPASMPKKYRIAADGEIMPHSKRPDIDNLFKLIADSMNGVFFKDDGQLSDVYIEKRYSANPRIEVELKVLGGS